MRKLLHSERCGARMHGTRGSRPPVRRYLCSTRRHGHGCDQRITRAEPLEEQLVDWISDFRPDEELRAAILASIRSAARDSNDDGMRRRELVGQLERLRPLRDGRPLQEGVRAPTAGTGGGVIADAAAV